MFYDYHMHSKFSLDSQSSMEDMIQRSIDLGLKEICFTDHVDYDLCQDDDSGINYEDYFSTLDNLAHKYKNDITIKKGVELGLQRQILDKCSLDVNTHPFDFVIASQHTIDNIELYFNDFYTDKSQHEAYEKYYNELYYLVKNYKDYSVLGHLDLIKRYGKYDNVLDDKYFLDIIESILKQVIYDGKGIELNTSSFRYNLPDLTPSRTILNLYKDLGGEIITTGSDSHNPSQVGYKFDEIYHYLKNSGFKYVCSFEKMQPNFIKL